MAKGTLLHKVVVGVLCVAVVVLLVCSWTLDSVAWRYAAFGGAVVTAFSTMFLFTHHFSDKGKFSMKIL